jgi:hypothetical protein
MADQTQPAKQVFFDVTTQVCAAARKPSVVAVVVEVACRAFPVFAHGRLVASLALIEHILYLLHGAPLAFLTVVA